MSLFGRVADSNRVPGGDSFLAFWLGRRVPEEPTLTLQECADTMGRSPEAIIQLAIAGIIPAEFEDGEPVLFRPVLLTGGPT